MALDSMNPLVVDPLIPSFTVDLATRVESPSLEVVP